MLTTLDKVWGTVFGVVTVACITAGASLPIIYLRPPQELPAPGHNHTFNQAMLVVAGMALGLAASLAVFGFLSRRFASSATHRRWAEALDDSNFLRSRAPGPVVLIRWALIPPEQLMRSGTDQP